MLIYILRHGQTDYNKNGIFQGRNNISLNEEGIKQITETSKELKKIKFDKIYVSPLKRTIETAKIVTENKLEIDDRIIERSFGKLEGKKSIPDYEERQKEFGIESIKDLENRVSNFLQDIINKNNEESNILIVTHGGVAQIINKLLDKRYNNNNFKNFKLENGKYICYEREKNMDINEWEEMELERKESMNPQKIKKIEGPKKDKLEITYIMVWTKVCGGSKIILEYASRLAEKGHKINIVTYDEKPTWYPLSDKVNFIQVPNNEDINNYIPESDVVVPTSWKCIYKAIESNKGPVAFFEQGGSHLFELEKLSDRKKEVVSNRISLPPFIYTVSQFSADKIKEIYKRNSKVIYNALESSIFYPREKERNTAETSITIVGSEDFKFKNIGEILEVIRELKEKHQIKLNWITQTKPTINKEPAIINPKQKIIGDVLRDTDIYICNSEYESFGLPTLEAMTCGAAVITTDTGGMRDFVIDGENALVIKHHDKVDMSKKLERLINDKELMKKIAKNGMETAQKFNWDNSIKEMEEYYRELAKYKTDRKTEKEKKEETDNER